MASVTYSSKYHSPIRKLEIYAHGHSLHTVGLMLNNDEYYIVIHNMTPEEKEAVAKLVLHKLGYITVTEKE